MSASLEEYLKTIYILINRNKEARVTDIAIEMNCSKPSVTKALNLLKQENLIDYESYGEILLTTKGAKLAEDILRKHLTLKAFLTEVLGIEEFIAEKEASSMKHAISENTIVKLEKYIESIIDLSDLECNFNPNSCKCRKCIKIKGNKKFALKLEK